MSTRRRATTSGSAHRFGGDWTTAKLQVVSNYLSAYTTALKHQRFRTGYIDAFAGTGYRTLSRPDDAATLFFPDLADPAPQALLDGSARLALKVEPRFDRYIFIEKSHDRCDQLSRLRKEFPALAADIEIREGEANHEIQRLCSGDWSTQRGVLFLDPYGMQVEWSTIEAIAATRAIDLWILFPLGIGVNRLLTRSGNIPDPWRRRLDLLLGTDDWYEAFYRVEPVPTLFGQDEARVVKATTETIGRYFNDRLKRVFPGVAEEPKVLVNSSRCPLYLLCFAVGNPAPRAVELALRIAGHILKKVD
jgi:three-Cys-motif partner protein